MNQNILILISAEDNADFIYARCRHFQCNKVFLCPIDRKAEAPTEILKKIFQEAQNQVETVDFLTRFNQDAFKNKDFYLNFLYDLGNKHVIPGINIKKYFAYPSENFSLWWTSLVYEKNPYKTKAFSHFCKIMTVLRLKNELLCQLVVFTEASDAIGGALCSLGKEKLLLTDKPLKSFHQNEIKIIFRELLRTVKYFIELLGKIFDCKKLRNDFPDQHLSLKNADFAFMTSFPFLDRQKLKDGVFVNQIYGTLQKSFEKYHPNKVAWLGMYAPIHESRWKESVQLARDVKKNQIFLLMEEWLRLKDFLRILKDYATIALKFFSKRKCFSGMFNFRDPVSGLSVNLWEVLKKDFYSSFMGKVLVWSISDYVMFSNIIQSVPSGLKLCYFAEIQGWEKALNAACQKRKDIECIGMQHTIVPLLYMSYFSHPKEYEGDDLIEFTPRPDFIGCVGSVTKDILEKSGFPKDKLFILGGFRFEDFLKKPIMPNDVQKSFKIIVAFANCAWENEEILLMLHQSIQKINIPVKFLLKSHPICPVEKSLKRLNIELNPSFFEITHEPLGKIVPQCQAMIVKESSSIYWALHNEIPAIVPMLYEIIDMCPLSGINSSPIYVKTVQQLINVIEDISKDQSHFQAAINRNFIAEYFDLYNDYRQYYDNLISKNPKVLEPCLSY